ncbi:MAG TPA: septum formation initiator family protein [Actinoplanes sp.]|nr:septum formation initiator family protein [Actinoplanes sp.]
MTQRRTPSGQGPAVRRPGAAGRPGGRSAARSGVRDTTTRVEPRAVRATPARASGTGRADGARSGSRPAAARRAVSTGATKRTVAARPRAFTGRATVLLVVLAALALAYTYPIRVYLAQESQIAQLQSDLAAQRAVIAGKAEEVAKWNDPEYVRTIARQRFYYVRPGEVPLVLLDDPEGAARDAAAKKPPAADPAPWYDTLWSSVAAANAEPRR